MKHQKAGLNMKTTKQKLEQIMVDFYKAIEDSGQRIMIGNIKDNDSPLKFRINSTLVELTKLINEIPEDRRFYIKRVYPNFYDSIFDRYTGLLIIEGRGIDCHDLESYCTMLNDGFSKQLQT